MLFGITGGISPIGIYATRVLSLRGFDVRILTRRNTIAGSTNIQIVNGDLRDPDTLDRFLDGVDIIIHIAGERINVEQMWSVNYLGTIEILRAIDRSNHGIKHLCYISSAGVYGRQIINPVTETAPCFPIGIYEKSKRAAELAFFQNTPPFPVSILRPTNVISPLDLGILKPMTGFSPKSLSIFLIKGREHLHLVHAEDVARAAIHIATMNSAIGVKYFNVSIDNDIFNYFSKVYAELHCDNSVGRRLERLRFLCAPTIIPHLWRRFLYGSQSKNHLLFSNRKIIGTGFHFNFTVPDIIRQIGCIHSGLPDEKP